MILELWKAHSGRNVLVFKAFDGENNLEVHKMLWWDTLDEEWVLTTFHINLVRKIKDIDMTSYLNGP